MKRTNPDSKLITRRGALSLGVSALTIGTLGIYGCSDTSGNASSGLSDALKAKIAPLLVGDIAAMAIRDNADDLSELTFNGPDGKPMKMSDANGKYRLVNLWATWCAPCRHEMPALDALQKAKGGDKFEVIAISVDGGGEEKPRAFFDEIGLTNLGFYHDPSINVFNALKKKSLALGLPVTLLLDENSRVVANMNGPAEWASPDAFKLIDAVSAL
ncbi:TlpA disulfide reductase family protein [Ahrensia sp. 13_GOM-1096m]|uniref:thiol:disulfide interchange protein TlpA n=1 Tax=Ahrensia sp. 13_GOM-1096m TaxID=1380380 RepID=UPI00047953CA|nr:TlpA disulfide reductase family protein [Ahrensia sp. 13_GOM-1096m]